MNDMLRIFATGIVAIVAATLMAFSWLIAVGLSFEYWRMPPISAAAILLAASALTYITFSVTNRVLIAVDRVWPAAVRRGFDVLPPPLPVLTNDLDHKAEGPSDEELN